MKSRKLPWRCTTLLHTQRHANTLCAALLAYSRTRARCALSVRRSLRPIKRNVPDYFIPRFLESRDVRAFRRASFVAGRRRDSRPTISKKKKKKTIGSRSDLMSISHQRQYTSIFFLSMYHRSFVRQNLRRELQEHPHN